MALHYNVLAGVEWYGKGRNLYLLPGVGLAISLINFYLYRILKNNENFFSFLSLFVTFCVQVILLAAVIFLARIN